MKLNWGMGLSLLAAVVLIAACTVGCDNGMNAEEMALLVEKWEAGASDAGLADGTSSDGGVSGGANEGEDSSDEAFVAMCHSVSSDSDLVYTIYVLPESVDAFVADGDLVGTCEEIAAAAEEEDALVAVCHYSPRDPDRMSTVYVDESELDEYLDSGDTLGPCEELVDDSPVDEGGADDPPVDLVAICHFPPDDPFLMETIFVEPELVDSYLDQGDLLGTCEELW